MPPTNTDSQPNTQPGGTPPVVSPDTTPPPEPVNALTERLTHIEATIGQIPGMIKRMVAEAKPATPVGEAKGNGNGKPEEANLASSVEAMKAELAALREENRREAIKSQLGAALAHHPLVEGIEPTEIMGLLERRVRTREDGQHVMTVERKLPASGQVVTEEVTIGDGVRAYFQRNTGFVRAQLQPGVNAQGKVVDPSRYTSWEVLEQNPDLLADAIRDIGREKVEVMRAEYNARKKTQTQRR